MKSLIRPLLVLGLALPVLGFAHDEGAVQRRAVSVSGEGVVSIKPDRARLSLGIDQFNPELKPAEAEVNRIARALLAETKALGIAADDVGSSAVTVNPEYVWVEQTRTQKLTGYRAHRSIEILVRNLDQIGDLILRATKVGVNQVSPPQLESSRARELNHQSLKLAAEDARARAGLLAQTLDAKLGPVRTISAQEVRPQPLVMKVMAMRSEAADGNAEMGLTTGLIEYRANVTADFDLLPP
jgi:hypothetical protein